MLLGSKGALVSLRRRAARDGAAIAGELDPAIVRAEGWDQIARLAADELVILRATDAFSSLAELLTALAVLDQQGMAFESLEEPWLTLRGRAEPAKEGFDALTADLGSRAAHFLDLSIGRLEADQRSAMEQQRREGIQSEIGKVVAQLFVLGPYAVAVGIISQAVLNQALLNPGLLLERLRDLVSGSNAVTGAVTAAIPDALRGVVFSAIGSLLLLVVRGTSIGLRAELGGALFLGVVTLCVYGLTAGLGTGLVGALVALPGLVLAIVITFEFTHMLLRVTASTGAAELPTSAGRGAFASLRRLLAELGRRGHPTRSRAISIAFLAIPLIAVLINVGAAFTAGGWLFWPARISLFALAGWGAWACLATPGAVRIPLWSMLGWATLLLLLSAATTVTAVFAVVVVLLLAGSAVELVFGHSDPEPAPA